MKLSNWLNESDNLLKCSHCGDMTSKQYRRSSGDSWYCADCFIGMDGTYPQTRNADTVYDEGSRQGYHFMGNRDFKHTKDDKVYIDAIPFIKTIPTVKIQDKYMAFTVDKGIDVLKYFPEDFKKYIINKRSE